MSRRLRTSWMVCGAIVGMTALALRVTTAQAPRPGRPAPLKLGVPLTVSGAGHSATILLPRPVFTLSEKESLHPQVPANFEAVFDGVVRVALAGKYEFRGDPADGAKVMVGGQDVGGKEIELSRGDHPIRVEYRRPAGAVRFQLQWRSEHFPWEVMPSRVLGHAELPAAVVEQSKVERGRMLVEELNCVGCHKADGSTLVGRVGPDLSDVGSRVTPAWMMKWLEDPKHFRAQAVMPRLLTKEENRRSVAAFLSTLRADGPPPPGPVATVQQESLGEALYDAVGCASCHGEDGKLVSLAGVGSKYASREQLEQYLLDPLKFDPSGRMPSMLLEKEEATALAAFLMKSKKPEYEGAFAGGDARMGGQLVRVIGCLNCHEVKDAAGRKVPPLMMMAVRAFRDLTPGRGCLSDAPRTPMPNYDLKPEDRESIGAFVASFKAHPDVARAPVYEFHRNAEKFACARCHNTRDTVALEGQELIPPLANSGMKLKQGWIERVLLDKARVRPWVDKRMPHFGEAVRPVVGQIVATSGLGAEPAAAVRDPEKVKAGQTLVGIGATGYGCTGCHTYKGSEVTVPPESRGPEITGMAGRIRSDWFDRWVRDPGRIQPNTAMPSFFTGKGEAETRAQIEALWQYLSLGEEMGRPEGLAQ